MRSWLRAFFGPSGVGVLMLCAVLILVIAHFVAVHSLAAVLGFLVGVGLTLYLRRRPAAGVPGDVQGTMRTDLPPGTVKPGTTIALTVVVAVTGRNRFRPMLRYIPQVMPPADAAAALRVLAHQIEADDKHRTAGMN